jgi:hypothetical protein
LKIKSKNKKALAKGTTLENSLRKKKHQIPNFPGELNGIQSKH